MRTTDGHQGKTTLGLRKFPFENSPYGYQIPAGLGSRVSGRVDFAVLAGLGSRVSGRVDFAPRESRIFSEIGPCGFCSPRISDLLGDRFVRVLVPAGLESRVLPISVLAVGRCAEPVLNSDVDTPRHILERSAGAPLGWFADTATRSRFLRKLKLFLQPIRIVARF